jgi:hypothetical protein
MQSCGQESDQLSLMVSIDAGPEPLQWALSKVPWMAVASLGNTPAPCLRINCSSTSLAGFSSAKEVHDAAFEERLSST